MTSRIARISLTVADAGRLAEFYQRALGFKWAARRGARGL